MWLTNLVFESDSVLLHFVSEKGRYIFRDSYYPYFFVICQNPEEMAYLLSQHPAIIKTSLEDKFTTIFSKTLTKVVKVTTSMRDFRKVADDIRKLPEVFELAETNLPHYFRYVNDKNLSFFSPCSYENNILKKLDSAELPQLKMGVLTIDDGFVVQTTDSKFRIRNLDNLRNIDVLFSYEGDKYLQGQRGVVTSPLGCFLRNTIHIDIRAATRKDIYSETSATNLLELGKERLVKIMELSSISSVKPDIVARISPGKLNTFLHFQAAKSRGYLIPDSKKLVERPKSLKILRIMDKGGLIYYPNPGIYENVAKCDFASMYPNIIIQYNISPEKMHCECGDDNLVPEVNWTICKKKGIIPQGIEKVLYRRLMLKKLMKTSSNREVINLQQKALKNILVTCFGYLGFSNFIFSNVECKECVMLYGREILKKTREIAIEEGLEVIYGIVDSVFVRNGSIDDYKRYVKRVTKETGIELELDLIFRKIAFPSSKENAGVANKYYGIDTDGKIEARGIALRHSDAPEFIKNYQKAIVPLILDGKKKEAETLYNSIRKSLISNEIPIEELAITKSVRKEKYKVKAPHAVAFQLAPNQEGYITYVYTKEGPKPLKMSSQHEIDKTEYLRILNRETENLFLGLS